MDAHPTITLRARLAGWPLRLAICAALGTWLVWQLEPSRLVVVARHLLSPAGILALLLYLAMQVCSASRWAGLAEPVGFTFSRHSFLRLYFEGMFFSLALPSSIGGDVWKAMRLSPQTMGKVLGGFTILADRLAGLSGMLILGLTALAYHLMDYALGPTVLVAAVSLVAIMSLLSLGMGVFRWVVLQFPRGHRLRLMTAQLIPYQARPELVWRGIGWGLLVQVLKVACVVCLGNWVLGLGLPLHMYCITMAAAGLAAVIPLSIAGLALREAAIVTVLSRFGVEPALALELGLLWFLVALVSGLMGGLVYLRGGPLLRQPVPVVPAAPESVPLQPYGSRAA